MNLITGRRMVAAEILKLRRHRGTMAASLALTVGITALYFVVIVLRHHGGFPGDQSLSDGTALMGLYFGSFAAILIGTEAGTIDLAGGTFRDLAATGRSRTALFLVRVPAAITVALAFTLSGFLLAVAAAIAFRGSAPAPAADLILRSAVWIVLATAVVTSLAVGVGSFTGSRSLTLTAVIGWETIATTLLYSVQFLGPIRDGVLLVALNSLRPGTPYGTINHPSSSNALPGPALPMAPIAAIIVILAWTIVPVLAGALRTRSRDA